VKTFWMFMPWMPLISGAKIRKHCAVLSTSNVWPIAGEFVQDGVRTAKLILTLEDFDLDCFYWNGFTFVSEKMRYAMALGPSDIQYFDVDASESAPLPQSKHYMTMHVPVTEDVSDLKNSKYTRDHLPGDSVKINIPSTVAFRPEAEPTHEIFYDRSFKIIYCTDEFALRVLQAGCSGAGFFHPSHFFDAVTNDSARFAASNRSSNGTPPGKSSGPKWFRRFPEKEIWRIRDGKHGGSGKSGGKLFVAICVGREVREEALRFGARSSEFRQHCRRALPHGDDMASIAVIDYPPVARPVVFRTAGPNFAQSHSVRECR
jgi:hypothetical protein